MIYKLLNKLGIEGLRYEHGTITLCYGEFIVRRHRGSDHATFNFWKAHRYLKNLGLAWDKYDKTSVEFVGEVRGYIQ